MILLKKSSGPVYPADRSQRDGHQYLVDTKLVALCHSVGKEELMDLIMPWRFIYFETVLRPEYFVM